MINKKEIIKKEILEETNNTFDSFICPICGEYEFVDDTEFEKSEDDYKGYQGDQCPHCGWIYDAEQYHDTKKSNGQNELSVEEYKLKFNNTIQDNPNYDFNKVNYLAIPHNCPVCEKYTFKDINSFDVCPYCGWEDDNLMEIEPNDWAGCSNDLCLNEYRKRYQHLISNNSKYRYSKDGI